MAENVRAKAEEIRTRVRTRIEEIRGGGSSPEHSPLLGNLGIFGGSSPALLQGGLVSEVKEKGLLAAARGRLEKLRTPAPAPPSPPVPEAEIARPTVGAGVGFQAEREFAKWRGVEAITPGRVARGRIAIEGS